MAGSTPFRVYEDFQPSTSLLEDDNSDTLILNLPGFRKEQVKVQIDSSGTLKINGERPIPGNKWSRFRKNYRTPANCITNQIRAKFENGVLHIMMPKTVTNTQVAPKPAIPSPPVVAPSAPSKKPATTESSKFSPPPAVSPPSQKPASTTESSKISPPPAVAPPSQKPATESKFTPPPSVAPPSIKPVTESKFTPPPPVPPLSRKPATEPIVPTPARETQPSRPSQISEAPTTEGLQRTAEPSAGYQMETRTDKGRRQDDEMTRMAMITDHDQEEKKSLNDVGKDIGKVLKDKAKDYVSGVENLMKKDDESTGKASHSSGGGGGGGGGGRKIIMDEYKNKIKEFMMELKEKSSSSSSSSSSNKSDLAVNVAVASLVLAALAVYATWYLKSSGDN